MKLKILIIVALIMSVTVASAATYSWEDENGTLNFTEDYGKIPKKFRKKAKLLGDEEQGPEPARVEQAGDKSVKPAPTDKTPEKTEPVETQGKEKAEFGGKTGAVWKSEFGKLNSDLKAAEDQLVQLRGRLKDISSMSRTEYLSLQASIKNVEIRVLDLRKKKEGLLEAANRSGVPEELR